MFYKKKYLLKKYLLKKKIKNSEKILNLIFQKWTKKVCPIFKNGI